MMTTTQALDRVMDVARRATMVREDDGRKRVLSPAEREAIEEAGSVLEEVVQIFDEPEPMSALGDVVTRVVEPENDDSEGDEQ